jgi:hypothetical protein
MFFLKERGFKPYERLIVIELLAAGPGFWATRPYLMGRIGYTTQYVGDAIIHLKKEGMIRPIESKPYRGGFISRYSLKGMFDQLNAYLLKNAPAATDSTSGVEEIDL